MTTVAEMPQRVVIVGAGASARFLVKKLRAFRAGQRDKVRITIVQPNKFSEVVWYSTLVLSGQDPFHLDSTLRPVMDVDETVYGVAVGCSDGLTGDGVLAVKTLERSEGNVEDIVHVEFDVLVVATGLSFPTILASPGQTLAARLEEIESLQAALKKGGEIVVGGGGAVGVELAGDLLETLPSNAKLTVICSSDRLISEKPPEYSKRAQQQLEKMGATIIFSDRVTNYDETITEGPVVLELKSGNSLECSVYIPAYNRGPNTAWLRNGLGMDGPPLPGSVLNEKGQVSVNENLCSDAYPKLYALGAASSLEEIALVPNIEGMAMTVAVNILHPCSKTHKPGPLKTPIYAIVGNSTFGMLMPDALQRLPRLFKKVFFEWCGYPCNLLCPCFLCGVVCGPLDPMICGKCCGPPEGEGVAKTHGNMKKKGIVAKMAGYDGVGIEEPNSDDMKR